MTLPIGQLSFNIFRLFSNLKGMYMRTIYAPP